MFRQRRDQQEAFFGGIFPRKAEPQHLVNGLFVMNVHHTQA